MYSIIPILFGVSVTYPFDITKTRLQIQGENNVAGKFQGSVKRGMVSTLIGIGKIYSY